MFFCYKIVRDYGFAPNPYYGVCTLATCKPDVREWANKGDWIAAFAGKTTAFSERLVCLMRVDDIISFDEYWNSLEYQMKKPVFDRRYEDCYGDNIYHHNDNNEWEQANSHHSFGFKINEKNLRRDTKTDRVLISHYYWYFGDAALNIPAQFYDILPNCRNYKKILDENLVNEFVAWVASEFEPGQHGFPFSLIDSNSFERYDGN